MRKAIFFIASSVLSLSSAIAYAQGESSKIGLEEVIVTAQKKATKLQKTPISISVMSSKDLENQHVQSLEDLMNGGTPSLRVAPFFSRSSALTVGIRGMVPFDANQPSRDATVGVYLDGVYLGRSQGLGAALFDIQRIEVLKGPQGTLFGRNTEGGAVSIVSKKPSGKLQARETLSIGNMGRKAAEIHLDLPKTAGISVKLDAIQVKRDGSVENPLETSHDFNEINRRGAHFGVLWEPIANFNAQYDFDTSYDATTSYYVQLLEYNPLAAVPLSPLVKVQANRAKTADIGLPQDYSIGHNMGHMLHANYKISDNNEVKYIGSWRKLSQSQYDNGIGAHSGPWRANAQFARYSLASLRQKQWSHELQLVGNLPQITYVGGLYYYHEEGDDDAWTPNTAQWNANASAYTLLPNLISGAAWAFPDRASNADASTSGAFGQFTYTPEMLDNKFHLTIGARYSHDKKSGVLNKVNGADVHYTFDINSNHTDPLVTMAYDANNDIHFYAKWGSAYRAGGANSRSVSYRAFNAEKVSTSEIGLKSEWFENRFRFNIAGYHTDYKDMQIDFSATNLNNSNRGTLETVNANGTAKIDGAEVELSYAPIRGLNLSLNYAYTKGEIPKAPNPFANNALSTLFLVYTPKNAANFAIDYEKPLNFAKLSAHLDYSYADGYHSSSSELALTDASNVVNGRLALSDIKLNKDTRLQIALWSRNLFNEQHTFYESIGSWAVLGRWGMYNEPRTFGVDFNVKY